MIGEDVNLKQTTAKAVPLQALPVSQARPRWGPMFGAAIMVDPRELRKLLILVAELQRTRIALIDDNSERPLGSWQRHAKPTGSFELMYDSLVPRACCKVENAFIPRVI